MPSDEDQQHSLPGRISRTSVARESRQSLQSGAHKALEHFDSNSLVGQSLFGEYLIKDVIGHGGMAVVYKALCVSNGKAVAVKTLKYADPNLMQRFIREIEIHNNLKHPNIVEAIDFRKTSDGRAFFVMELLQGRSIEDLFATKIRFTKPERVARIIFAVCDALSAAHAKGIIHRDIKPGNIIVSKQGDSEKISVVDFGLAKLYEDLQRITKTGQVLGSPVYMSPEQCLGEDLDPRSDVYSLAIVLYEMVTGELPYSAMTPVTMMESHCNPAIHPRPVNEVVPNFPCAVQLGLILRKAMETELEDRFQSVDEFKQAFNHWYEFCQTGEDRGYFEGVEFEPYLNEKESNGSGSSTPTESGNSANRKSDLTKPSKVVANASSPYSNHSVKGFDKLPLGQTESRNSAEDSQIKTEIPSTSELDSLVNKKREDEVKKRTEELNIGTPAGALAGSNKGKNLLISILLFVVLVSVFAGGTILLCCWYYKI